MKFKRILGLEFRSNIKDERKVQGKYLVSPLCIIDAGIAGFLAWFFLKSKEKVCDEG